MRSKIILSLSAIAVILLTSSVISIIEYSTMSNYVSDLIADNINSINVAQKLSTSSDAYNLGILTVIGDDSKSSLPDFNQAEFMAHCDSLRASLTSVNMAHLADSVEYSYSAYMLTSLELPEVLLSNFIDSREWYFKRLQPRYNRLHSDIDALSTAIYNELQKNSATFERGFYRSVIPGAVAVAVGLLLILLLMFFLISYYVNPIRKIQGGLNNYRSYNKKYSVTFEGNDELNDINTGITEITVENQQMRARVKSMREKLSQAQEAAAAGEANSAEGGNVAVGGGNAVEGAKTSDGGNAAGSNAAEDGKPNKYTTE